jgi:hypothetical protein
MLMTAVGQYSPTLNINYQMRLAKVLAVRF